MTPEQKFEVVKTFLESDLTLQEVANKYRVQTSEVIDWMLRYEERGMDGLAVDTTSIIPPAGRP